MKRRIPIGSLSGPNFAIRTAKMVRARSSVYRLPNYSIFCFNFLGHKEKNARNVFYLVMSEVHDKFYFLEPLTEAGEEARLKE